MFYFVKGNEVKFKHGKARSDTQITEKSTWRSSDIKKAHHHLTPLTHHN